MFQVLFVLSFIGKHSVKTKILPSYCLRKVKNCFVVDRLITDSVKAINNSIFSCKRKQ